MDSVICVTLLLLSEHFNRIISLASLAWCIPRTSTEQFLGTDQLQLSFNSKFVRLRLSFHLLSYISFRG